MKVVELGIGRTTTAHQRIRIALAIDDNGNWTARGGSHLSEFTLKELIENDLVELDGDAQQQFWLVVDVPLPPTERFAGSAPGDE